jgi:peptidoglycan-N-acetylglucosamine deacetylase
MRAANLWRWALGPGLALAVTAAAAPQARAPAPAARLSPLVAFYIPWDAPALASLKANVGKIDIFAPMWASLVAPSGKLVWESDEEAHAVLATAPRRPKVIPIVSNAHDDVWDAPAAESVILNDQATAALAANVVKQAKADHLAGVVVDFENLTPRATAGYAAFLGRLRQRLRPAGLEVWTTTTLSRQDGLPDLAAVADGVVLMAYDQCWATSTPGPIASDAWLKANLAAKLAGGDPRRYVVALAGYGYDWPAGRPAQVVSATQAAQRVGATVAPLPNPHGSYQANGVRHEVWWLSGADFARQRAIAEGAGVRAVALWRMGLEDPALWTAKTPPPLTGADAGPTATCEPLKR